MLQVSIFIFYLIMGFLYRIIIIHCNYINYISIIIHKKSQPDYSNNGDSINNIKKVTTSSIIQTNNRNRKRRAPLSFMWYLAVV